MNVNLTNWSLLQKELLIEFIAPSLSIKTLCRMQQVCRSWRNAIFESFGQNESFSRKSTIYRNIVLGKYEVIDSLSENEKFFSSFKFRIFDKENHVEYSKDQDGCSLTVKCGGLSREVLQENIVNFQFIGPFLALNTGNSILFFKRLTETGALKIINEPDAKLKLIMTIFDLSYCKNMQVTEDEKLIICREVKFINRSQRRVEYSQEYRIFDFSNPYARTHLSERKKKEIEDLVGITLLLFLCFSLWYANRTLELMHSS